MAQNPEHTWGHTLPFGEEYYQGVTSLLSKVYDDAEIIAGVAQKAAAALRAGKKVYTDAAIGHMPPTEMEDEREGNPAQIHCCGHNCSPEDYAALEAGDVLITNSVNDSVRQARDAGVYVVGLPTAYVNNSRTPPDKIHPNPNGWVLEDVSSEVVETYIPWEQGIVHIPQMPELPAFPVSSNLTCAIHWMLTVGTTAAVVAKRIIGGGRFFVRSRNPGVQGDANSVASGLMLTNAFEMRPAEEGGDQDTFVIAAVSPDDPQELEWAAQARANGNYIIGIGPENSPALQQGCDLYFSNRCAEAAGVVEVEGRDEKICPATGILNNIILQVLTAQFTDEMCRRGAVPYFWMGVYRVGGGDYNATLSGFFRQRGY